MCRRDVSLVAKLTRSPRKTCFFADDHLRLLSGADESVREALRTASFRGPAEDRIPAVIALARIGDARADEALGGLLDEDDFAPQVAAELVHLEHGPPMRSSSRWSVSGRPDMSAII